MPISNCWTPSPWFDTWRRNNENTVNDPALGERLFHYAMQCLSSLGQHGKSHQHMYAHRESISSSEGKDYHGIRVTEQDGPSLVFSAQADSGRCQLSDTKRIAKIRCKRKRMCLGCDLQKAESLLLIIFKKTETLSEKIKMWSTANGVPKQVYNFR